MVRSLLLVASSTMLLGLSCQLPPALTALDCANNLDGTEFGFTLTIPSGFECVDTGALAMFPFPDFLLAFVPYLDSSNTSIVIVVSRALAGGEGSEQASAEELSGAVETLDPETTDNGVEFAMFRVVPSDSSDARVGYSAAAQVSGGSYILLIAIQAENVDDDSLLATLREIMASVVLTSGG